MLADYLIFSNNWRNSMELYIIAALFFVYIITAVANNKLLVYRIWTTAFIFSFVCLAISICFLRTSGQDVMLTANEWNWYYFLYLFSALSLALGLINCWMYRHFIWNLFRNKSSSENQSL